MNKFHFNSNLLQPGNAFSNSNYEKLLIVFSKYCQLTKPNKLHNNVQSDLVKVRVLSGDDADDAYITMATTAMTTSRVRDAGKLTAPDSLKPRSVNVLHLSLVQHLPHSCTSIVTN